MRVGEPLCPTTISFFTKREASRGRVFLYPFKAQFVLVSERSGTYVLSRRRLSDMKNSSSKNGPVWLHAGVGLFMMFLMFGTNLDPRAGKQ